MCAHAARRTDQFFVTVGGLEYYESIRSDFLLYFEGVEEYCVSVEKKHVNKLCHIHAYLNLRSLCSLVEVRECAGLDIME
jgi:hypothetical protein